MTRNLQRFGKKQKCSCSRGKISFAPLLGTDGQPTGGGKCWSPACGQRFFPPPSSKPKDITLKLAQESSSSYVYRTSEGHEHMRITVVRYTDGCKRAYAERWQGSQWIRGVKGLERIPYRLPELLERVAIGGTVMICEGEKDCDRASTIGITATCNPFGAGKWTDDMSSFLVGARVTIIPDLDNIGQEHGESVRQSLLRAGVQEVRVLNLHTLMPDLPEKSDLSDYLDRHGDAERLRQAVESDGPPSEKVEVTSTPLTPPCIAWENLPEPLAQLTASVDDDLQRVALLVASITVTGSILPDVQTLYCGQYYSPSLYLFVVGPPGSGKGVVTPAQAIVGKIDKQLREVSVRAIKDYQDDVQQNRKCDQRALTPNREKPILHQLFVPADSTGPVVIRAICNNQSILVFDSEGDALSTALRPDTTDASSAFRKAWHHERIDHERVTDAISVATDRPHVCLVLTGTPNQVYPLVKHVESGLTSRFCFITFPQQKTFRNPFLEHDCHVRRYVSELQEPMYDLWEFVRKHSAESPFLVVLSGHHQATLFQHFKERYEDSIEESDAGTTLRAGIVAVRIITVLTVLRHWFGNESLPRVMTASDDDFTVGLNLAEFLRRGTDQMILHLSGEGKPTFRPIAKRPTQSWYDSLPDEFDTHTALTLAKHHGVSRSNVYRILAENPRIIRVKHGHYRKQSESQSNTQ